MEKKTNWLQLFLIILVTELTGFFSSLLSGITAETYSSFVKPPLSPPGWVFGVVWPILYLLMSIAVFLIYQSPESPEREKAINLYWIQLFFNFLWSIIFFRFGLYWLAVVEIILLDILVIITAISFCKIKKPAGYLMIPYILWLLFATYLNIGVAILN